MKINNTIGLTLDSSSTFEEKKVRLYYGILIKKKKKTIYS